MPRKPALQSLSLCVVFYFLYLVFNVVKMVGDVLLSVQPLCAMIAHTAVPITTPNTSAAELPPCPVTCATFASWNALLVVSMSKLSLVFENIIF